MPRRFRLLFSPYAPTSDLSRSVLACCLVLYSRLQRQGKPLESATVALRYRVTTLHSILGWEQSQSVLHRTGEGGGKAGGLITSPQIRSPNISLQTLTLGPSSGGHRVYLHRKNEE